MTNAKVITCSTAMAPSDKNPAHATCGDDLAAKTTTAEHKNTSITDAAASGHLASQVRLGTQLVQVPGRHDEGYQWTLVAAQRGAGEAQLLLAKLLALGHGCSRDKPMALRWLKRARLHNGNQISDDDVACAKHMIAIGEKVCARERLFKWSTNTLSISGRVQRFQSHDDDASSLCFGDVLAQMVARSKNGSSVARDFVQGYTTLKAGVHLLEAGDITRGIATVRQAHRFWNPLDVPRDVGVVVQQAARRLLDASPSDADALYVEGVYGVKATPAIYWLHCTTLHPTCAAFHHALGAVYASAGQYESALRSFTKAIAVATDATSNETLTWCYERAACLRKLLGTGLASVASAVAAYEGYVRAAPRDHRKVPEAWYALGLLYAAAGRTEDVRHAFGQGVAAEACRLHCLPPLNFSTKQRVAKYLLHATDVRRRPLSGGAVHGNASPPIALDVLRRMHRLPL
ncbi:hypothetical protein SPRG_01912 [Saprolegnia parasitica CBS 223.65]|uniref:Uncharacterized protein n=1 Tax=Saprolegnia parasitica (strain CBS 223.65) TaxID=695850 RepID=A0A067CV21_SAPPC|nr:hypothetical protein SPRG_01912 [Saprolegnia parasitica CBS 223.65]KDO33100.1 hypothetical protein SPRG_01912 [Saprolegnia parasitica CBS 223.65]|eukprot:XP_012195868.1 hypothetical protein SPRG_01912 [Saprolegnia parasitica CBS 223.65]